MQSLLILLFLFCMASPAMSIPNLMSYQGVLKDADDIPLAGPVNMSFRVYDAESDGNLFWMEEHTNITLNNGIYNILLGDGNTLIGSFDINLFSKDSRWPEVVVNGEVL